MILSGTVIREVNYTWFEKWKGLEPGARGQKYEDLKGKFANEMLEAMFELFPFLRDKLDCYDVCTPLTREHYIRSEKGKISITSKGTLNSFPFAIVEWR